MGRDDAKQCSVCAEVKLLDEFSPHALGFLGRHSRCKVCSREVNRRQREKYKARDRVEIPSEKRCPSCGETKLRRFWSKAASSPDGLAPYCRECNRDRCRQYYQDNIERERERSRGRDKPSTNNPEYQRRYYLANKDRINERGRQWYAENRESHAATAAKRRARRAGADVVESFTRREVYERDAGQCHACGKPVAWSDFEVDRLVPLASGGDHSLQNVAAAHRYCNRSRGTTGPAQLRLAGRLIADE